MASSQHIPHCSPASWPPDIPPGKFAAGIHSGLAFGCRVALIGLPDDTGVRLNNGRPGAAAGPAAFRVALARYGVAQPHGLEWPKVFDAGDVTPAPGHDENALQETHRRVTEAVEALLDLRLIPIAIGGGHDLTFPFVRASAKRFGRLGGVYFDAHLDVRQTVGSGMAFRKLVEECGVGPLLVDGLDMMVNSREHAEWFLSRGGQIAAGDDNQFFNLFANSRHMFVSFDLDVLDSSIAPGVSAVNPNGAAVADVAHAVFALGADPRVRCFDIMELNPAHDADGRTARVAAHLFLQFLSGLALRPHDSIEAEPIGAASQRPSAARAVPPLLPTPPPPPTLTAD